MNFHKSHVGVVGFPDMDLTNFSNCLNCGRMSLPFKYLGIRIGENSKKV